MQALFTLTPAESKRLIGKGIAALPEVQNAKQNGYLLVSRGSTTAYCLEEMLGQKIEKKRYAVGQTIRGIICAIQAGDRAQAHTPSTRARCCPWRPARWSTSWPPGTSSSRAATPRCLRQLGVLMVSPTAAPWAVLHAHEGPRPRDHLPGGPREADPLRGGGGTLRRHHGHRQIDRDCQAGMACVADGRPFTEIDALETLFDVSAIHLPRAAGAEPRAA